MPSSLRALLRRVFSADELRRFVTDLPGCNEELLAQIPAPSASLDTLIDVVLEVLDRRQMIDADFFIRLVSERPAHSTVVGEIARERGLPPSHAAEIAFLLSNQRDAAVERKLSELERSLDVTITDRRELNLAVADLSQWHQEAEASPEQSSASRAAIVRRLTALVNVLSGRSLKASEPPSQIKFHPDALGLRDAIETHVRRADGERAVRRLLDLAERFATDKGTHRAAIMMSAQVQTWRSAHKLGSKLSPEERREWIQLLQSVLDLTDQLVTSSGAAVQDSTGSFHAIGNKAQITDPLFPVPNYQDERGALLLCSSLSKRYEKGGRFALKDVSITLFPRTIVGVVGPNGSGKSTLLSILSGEKRLGGGTLSYPQLDPAGVRTRSVDWPAVRSRIAYLPQRLPIWHGDLAKNLNFWATSLGIVGRENTLTVEHYIERLGLSNYRNATWGEISGGYQTRFALAKALVGRPRILLLDEPLAALDLKSQQRFLQDLQDIVRSSSQQQSVILSSQHIPEIESIADELIGLRDDGGVWFQGTLSQLARDRPDSIFELGGPLSESTRDRLTARFGPGSVQQRESIAILRTTHHVNRAEVLELLQTELPPAYYRDISASLTRMFWKEEHER